MTTLHYKQEVLRYKESDKIDRFEKKKTQIVYSLDKMESELKRIMFQGELLSFFINSLNEKEREVMQKKLSIYESVNNMHAELAELKGMSEIIVYPDAENEIDEAIRTVNGAELALFNVGKRADIALEAVIELCNKTTGKNFNMTFK